MLLYFLSDDTMQILDVSKHDGRDPWLTFVYRQKVPKNYSGPGEFGQRETDQTIEYFSPADFMVGKTVRVFNRNLLINNCDEFTKKL